MAGPEASRYVNLAKWLEDFPLTREAFGRRGCRRRTLSRSARRCAGCRPEYWDQVEPHLVDYAFTCRPEDIASFVETLLDALGLDKASDVRRERRYAERGVDIGLTSHGQRNIAGTLTPEVGEKLAKALAIAAAKAGADDDRTPSAAPA